MTPSTGIGQLTLKERETGNISCCARQKSKKHNNFVLKTQGQEVKHNQKGQRNKKERKQ